MIIPITTNGVWDRLIVCVGALSPNTSINMDATAKRIPLNGFPVSQANTATDKRGMHINVPNNLFEGCHLNINAIISR